MKSLIIAITVLASMSCYAEKTIYQESYTKDTCMVIHTHRNGFDMYDLYSSPNLFGTKFQATATLNNNNVTLEGTKWESFCSNGALASHTSDQISVQCSDINEGMMVIKQNKEGALREVSFISQNETVLCRNLLKTN